MIEQVLGDLDGRGDVERRLPVPAARVHHGRVGSDECLQDVEHPVPRGRVRVNPGATLDEERGKPGVVVENSKAARPPVAPRVDVGAGAEQDVDHFPVAGMHRAEQRRRAKGAVRHRVVERGLQLGIAFEDLGDPSGVVGSDGRRQRVSEIGRAHV